MSWTTFPRGVGTLVAVALAAALLASCGGGTGSSVRDLEVTMQLDATAVASTEVQLHWTPHPGITHYAIHVNRVLAFDGYWSSPGPAYKFTGLLPVTSYCYRIVAIQDFWPVATVAVGRSNEACVKTPADLPPSAPTEIMATPVSPASIRVTWRPATDDYGVTAYRVYRDDLLVGQGTAAAAVYGDGGLHPASRYCYKVSAMDAAGHETRSAVPSCATTLADVTPPTAPGNFVATSTSGTQVHLSWTAATDDGLLLGYRVYRDGVWIADVPDLERTDAGLEIDSRYCYDVTAYDAGGNESEARSACAIAGWTRRVLDWMSIDSSPALAVDAAGTVRVAYCKLVVTGPAERADRLTIIVPGGNPQDIGSPNESVCRGPDLAHDSLLAPHISYYGAGDAVKHWAGYAEIVSLSTISFSSTAIAVDAADRVHLAYVVPTRDRDIVYMVKEGGAWSSRVIDRIDDCYQPTHYRAEVDLAVEPAGTAHLAYLAPVGDGTCEVRHASNRAGEWAIEKVDASPGGAAPPSVGVTRDGEIRIGYALHRADGVAELRLASRGAASWSIAVISAVTDAKRPTSLAIGPDGATHLGLSGAGAVYYATDASGAWREITLEQGSYYGRPSIAIDAQGRVHFAYQSPGTALIYATR
jgi:chitodextrinase